MIKQGNTMDLSEFIRQYSTNRVFTGQYFGDVMAKSDDSVRAKSLQVQKDIENNNLLSQLSTLDDKLRAMGLAADVIPQTNGGGDIIGYRMTVYDPNNRNKVYGNDGKRIDVDSNYSEVRDFQIAFDDTVKLGHSGINDYVDILNTEKNEVVRLKRNEAQFKILNDKLTIMQGKAKKNKNVDKLGIFRSSLSMTNSELKSVEQKTKSNYDDKDKGTHSSGSQMLDSLFANKINLSPVITQMKYAYNIDERYNKKVMEVYALVSQAESKEEALKILDDREKDLRKGIKKYDGFKHAMLSLNEKNLVTDYANTSETAYSIYKASTPDRNMIAGDVLLSPVLREQGRKNVHNIRTANAEKAKKMNDMFFKGVLASKSGEARDVNYGADITNKNGELAYDASVKAIELSDKDLAKAGKRGKDLSVREGQSIVSDAYAEILDTSHHTMSQSYSKDDLDKEIERLKERKKELEGSKDEKGNEVAGLINNKELSKSKRSGYQKELKEIDRLLSGGDEKIDKKELVAYMFKKYLKQEGMNLFKQDPNSKDDLVDMEIISDDAGGYSVSGEGNVRFQNGRRGVDTNMNARSAMVKGHGIFKDIDLKDASGNSAGDLESHNIQVITGSDQLDSRKYGTRMKTDIISTLIDMRQLDKLGEFFKKLKEDASDDKLSVIERNAADFFDNILTLSQNGKVYITDNVDKVNEYFNGASKEQLSGYLDYLDTMRAKFGGNEGLGKVYSVDKEGNLERTAASRVIYTNLGGDDNVQYGWMKDSGAVDYRTGRDSLERSARITISNLTDEARKEFKNIEKTASDIVDFFDAPERNKKELEEMQESNRHSIAAMKKSITKPVDVKSLTSKKKKGEKSYVTIGKGEGYDIDIDDVEEEILGEDGKARNGDRTLSGKIDEFLKTHEEAKNAQVVIDTQGNLFKNTVAYGDKTYGYGGTAIYLDQYNGKNRGYSDRSYSHDLNKELTRALQFEDNDDIKKSASDLVAKMWNSVNNKDGADYQRLLKNKMSHSMSGKTTAVNMDNILSAEDYAKADKLSKLKSDINSFGVQISREAAMKFYDGFKADDSNDPLYKTEELRKMVKDFADLGAKFKIKKNGEDTNEVLKVDTATRDQLLDAVMDALTIDTEQWKEIFGKDHKDRIPVGMQAVLGRFPFMNGLDLDSVNKVFIGRGVEGEQMKIGAGLALKENADYDGDHENIRITKFVGDESKLFNLMAGDKEDILRKLARIAKIQEEKDESQNQVFSDDFNFGVSEALIRKSALLASRRNKGATGTFSNYATQTRNTMKDIGFDETGLRHGLDSETEDAVAATIIRTFFEAMEQDMISAKKVIKRLVKEYGKQQIRGMSQEQIEQIAKDSLEQVDSLVQDFTEGKITFSGLTEALKTMGIMEETQGADGKTGGQTKGRVNQAGLLSIEKIKGGKEALMKATNGQYLESGIFENTNEADAEHAQAFKDNGGFEAWDKSADAQELYARLAAAKDAEGKNLDIKYDKKALYNLLLSGKNSIDNFGVISEDLYKRSFERFSTQARLNGEFGYDGTADAVLKNAKNKTHSKDKKNAENNAYHVDNTPLTEEEKAAIDGSPSSGINNGLQVIIDNLNNASGDAGKALATLLQGIINFSNGVVNVSSGILPAKTAAKIMEESSWFRSPYSTTSITKAFDPYDGASMDPNTMDKILANKDKKYLGYASSKDMKAAMGSEGTTLSSLVGHVVGQRTQFAQSLRDMALEKGWKGKEEDLIKVFTSNLSTLEAEDNKTTQQTVKFYKDYRESEKKYFEALEAIHGENGLNDKKFFLAKQGFSSYDDILKKAYANQSASLGAFFAPDRLVKDANGKAFRTISEASYVGMADGSGETNYLGRTDVEGLIKQQMQNADGTTSEKNVLALVDQKTKLGEAYGIGDILQGLMNATAANQDIELAKRYAQNGGYDEWVKNPAIKAQIERAQKEGAEFDPEERYQRLIAADTARSYIQKTNKETGKTEMVALDSLFQSFSSKKIMAAVADFIKGNMPQAEIYKLIQSEVTRLTDAGVNIDGEKSDNPYAHSTQGEVAEDYLKLNKRLIRLEEKKKELEWNKNDTSIERSDEELDKIDSDMEEIQKQIDDTKKSIRAAKKTKARLTRYIDKNGNTVKVNDEIDKAQTESDADFEKFKNDQGTRLEKELRDYLSDKAKRQAEIAESDVRRKYKYGLDTPEKIAEDAKKRNENAVAVARIDGILQKRDYENLLGSEKYKELMDEHNTEVAANEKVLADGVETGAKQQALNDYLKLLQERVDLREKEKEILYEIAHLSEKATKEQKEALDVQKKQLAADIDEKNKKIAEQAALASDNIEPDKLKEYESDIQTTSDNQYAEYVTRAQNEAKAEFKSTINRIINLQKAIKERNIRSAALGRTSGNKAEKLSNQLLNERDRQTVIDLQNSLKGTDWESAVGGAGEYSKIISELAKSSQIADQQMAALNADLNPTIWDMMKNSVKGWFNQMLRGQIVWKVLGAIQSALKGVIEDAKKLDSVLVDLQIVTGDTRDNTKSLISTYSSLAQQLHVTTSEVASAANDWLRQGYSVSETTDLITASMQLSKLGMIESGQATSYLTSMLKGFKLEASDATSVVDKLTKVDMSAATSAGDIAESLRQFATTAQLSGLDLDESIAMATTIMDVSQKDASSTGNAIKTMLSRYGNVKAGTYSGMNIIGDQNETTESLNDIEKVLRKLGISLRSSNLEFREFDDVLDDIAAKWDTLDSVSKNAIATAMAGTRQRESFLVLMENYDKYKDFIDEAANAEGTAAEKYKAYEDSLEASQKKLTAAWEELASRTEVVDFLKNVNDVLEFAVKVLPYISRIFVRLFTGKAAVTAMKILGRSSLPKKISSVGEAIIHPIRTIKDKSKNLSNPLLREGRFSDSAKTVGRSGLIDSQIRRGTSPILEVLKEIAANTSKTKDPGKGGPNLDGMPGEGKEKDPSKMTNDEILKSKNISYKDKKKLLNDRKFNDEIKENKKKRNELKKKAKSGDKSLKKAYSEERKKLKERNEELKEQQKEFNKNFEENEYIATHAEEATLEDGTKFSDIHKNEDGTYSAKGRKESVSEDEYNKAKAQQEANDQAASKEFKAKKAAAKNEAAMEGAAAGIAGFMSAETNNAHYNKFTGEWVERETTNKNAEGLMRANTGIATALGTYFGGEFGGQLAGAAADAVNRYLIGYLPSVENENKKQDRFDQTDKKKSQVESVKSSISNVVDIASKDLLTADDYSNLVQAQDAMRDELTKSDNAALKDEFVAYANKFLAGQSEGNEYAAKSFDELTNLADMTDAQRKKTAYAMKVAQTKQENAAENAEYEKELDALNTDIDNDYLDVSGYNEQAAATTATLTSIGALSGAAIGASAGMGIGSWATGILGAAVGGLAGYGTAQAVNEEMRVSMLNEWNDKSRDEQIAKLEKMQETGQGNSAKLQEMISKLTNINDTIKKIRDKMDQQRVEEGILEMSVGKNADGTDKTLLDMSANAIKDMGTDEIVERMASYLQDKYGGMADGSSYFYEDENGNKQVTASARASILKGLKSNTDIYGAITGQNSRLSDVLGMKDGQTKTEMLENFANALHVSVDELNNLGDTFGQFTLGDLTASAEELSGKFSNLESTISNIASGTQSWSTTLQNVTKNYPELLGYASDEYSLSLAMFQKMKDYQSLQTDAQMSDIMSNEAYFDTFSDKLKETLSGDEWDEFRQAQINSFNDLQQYVANTDSDLAKKLNEAAQEELSNIKLASDTERQTLEKVISIKSAQIDKEVNNLTAQKTAMQNINSQREYENKLIEAKLKLENASKEKKRVWREGVGWVYEEDQAAISDAKKNLDSVTNEKAISALDQQITQLNTDKENLSAILSDQEEAIQAAFLRAYEDANGVTNGSIESLGSDITEALNASKTSADEKWKEWLDVYKKKESTAKDTLAEQYEALQKAKEAMNKEGLTDEERAKAQENYNSALAAYQNTYNSGVSNGYWKADDFKEGGEMYDKLGGAAGNASEATTAGAGGAGYKKAEPDQFLYRKTNNGKWQKFIFNPGKTKLVSSSEWNRFYDKDGNAWAALFNSNFDENEATHELSVNKNTNDVAGATIYQAAKDNTSSTGFASWLNNNYPGPTLGTYDGLWVRFLGGLAYKLDDPETVSEEEVPEDVKKNGGQFRRGSTDISQGNRIPLLMNEEGTEAIVTPQGTITALPSHSGILPEDITTNLWSLGNLAPDLLMALQRQSLIDMGNFGSTADNSVDNSVNINTVQMTVDADDGFNVDSFVRQLQQVAALTRNNKH